MFKDFKERMISMSEKMGNSRKIRILKKNKWILILKMFRSINFNGWA